jgi:hypothetical protein
MTQGRSLLVVVAYILIQAEVGKAAMVAGPATSTSWASW